MKIQVANKMVNLKIWEGYGKKRVYLEAFPTDGSKPVGKSYDWGFVDENGLQDGRGGYTNYRYAKQMDPEGFEAMVAAAKEMLK
jgi:hypothetical protein